MIPHDPTDIEALAAEYVLGTLDAQRDEVRRALEHGPDPGSDAADIEACERLRRSVAWWEEHLAVLLERMEPVQPPAELWSAIESRIGVTQSETVPPRPAPGRSTPPGAGFWESLTLWRSAAGAAFAACVAILIWTSDRTAAPVSSVALLTPAAAGGVSANPSTGTFLLERQGARLRVTPIGATPTPPGRDLELWSLAGGKPAPLGLVHATGYLDPAPFAVPGILPSGTPVALSLEPAGGSPSGQPTGPVLYLGLLTEVAQPS